MGLVIEARSHAHSFPFAPYTEYNRHCRLCSPSVPKIPLIQKSHDSLRCSHLNIARFHLAGFGGAIRQNRAGLAVLRSWHRDSGQLNPGGVWGSPVVLTGHHQNTKHNKENKLKGIRLVFTRRERGWEWAKWVEEVKCMVIDFR